MRVITSPGVYVISAPMFFPPEKYELPEHINPAENIIALAGKVCYDSYGKDGRSVAAHVQALGQQRHYSVLEHANFGLFIEGISRGCSHELVRHRHFSFSQRSTRYTKEDDAAFVLDPFYADMFERLRSEEQNVTQEEADLVEVFLASCESSLDAYNSTITRMGQMSEDSREQRGIPLDKVGFRKWMRGKARQLLPHALETRMVMTGNLTAWREMLVKRTSRHAEAEIRRLAHMIYETIRPLAPNAFEDIAIGMVDGYVELKVV